MMSEAVNFVLKFGFKDLNLGRIEAFTNRNIFYSIKLLQNLKFIFDKDRRDEMFPENLIFKLNRSQKLAVRLNHQIHPLTNHHINL